MKTELGTAHLTSYRQLHVVYQNEIILTASVWVTEWWIKCNTTLARILEYKLYNLLTIGKRKILLEKPLVSSRIWIIWKHLNHLSQHAYYIFCTQIIKSHILQLFF